MLLPPRCALILIQARVPCLPPQELEGRWASLNSSIQELRAERAGALAGVVECEQQVLVWERRVQLEKEIQVGIGDWGAEGRLLAVPRVDA